MKNTIEYYEQLLAKIDKEMADKRRAEHLAQKPENYTMPFSIARLNTKA